MNEHKCDDFDDQITGKNDTKLDLTNELVFQLNIFFENLL